MSTAITSGLSSRSGFVRKGTIALLQVPRFIASLRAGGADFAARPPVLANSFPKSGTHLLAQIVAGLPDRTNYGAFLASMTSSFQFRERSPENAGRFIRGFVPGEIVRGHLFFHPQYVEGLSEKNVVHYFLYRDLRDVVVSEAHYLWKMNRWHRLHRYFRRLESIEDAISLAITGFNPPIRGIEYPNIAERFARYRGWLGRDDCAAIRFEDLMSERRQDILRQMAEFYGRRCDKRIDADACSREMASGIAPERSHTFRSGKRSGWRSEFTAVHRQLFREHAGDLLIELGYELNYDWTVTHMASSP